MKAILTKPLHQNFRVLRSFVLALLIMVLPQAVLAKDVVSDAYAILTDPLKIDSGTENAFKAAEEIRNSILALGALQDELDADIDKYLRDIDNKITMIEYAGIELQRSLTREIEIIERRLFNRLKVVARDVQCSVIDASDQILDDAFSRLPPIVRAEEVVYELPFGEVPAPRWRFWNRETQPITVTIDLSTNPTNLVQYRTIHDAYVENFAEMKPDDDLQKLTDAYADLAALAMRAACFFRGQVKEDELLAEHAKYNAMVYPWQKF
ncbi:hypothetical protein KUW14_03295 [Pseudooceanicola nitratireducens]|uniref:hypothetical protein n=1 Tax=Pseudooceanicola nitratireducens TaxID=517719 RepID=UPI001C948911|nr:hypothetical protein [Pseudooceanicola nitratireducens]MBY6164864.1 hypothetical protein [Pseudooceanicola nitratireducens]